MKSKKLNKLIVVTWEDAWNNTNLYHFSDETVSSHHYLIETVGWCIQEDDHGIAVAQERHLSEEKYRGHFFIPRTLIRKVKVLK